MKITKSGISEGAIVVVVLGLMLVFFIMPLASSMLPVTYTGILRYKSPIQSFGIGIGSENNIYLVIGNETITCQLLEMTSAQQARILTLQINETVTITTIGQGRCDTK